MQEEDIIVLKFGSSVLRTAHDLPNVVHEIYRWYRDGHRVIAVVSAFANATERLIQESYALSVSPEPFAMAELLATGERTTAALLGIVLDRAGVPARVASPREIGFEVAGTPLDADPIALDVARIEKLLLATPVLVVPGFFGTDAAGRTHCLGRGGSDLTAAFLAVALRSRCRLLKDVDGVYESDPAEPRAQPRRLPQLSYACALEVASQLIQPKAVAHLKRHSATCEVAALASPLQSLISSEPRRVAEPAPLAPDAPDRSVAQRRRAVVLLGLGTVGSGVQQRLIANGDRFHLLGILVRDRAKHRLPGIPLELLHSRLDTLRCLKPDLVIDALPGLSPSFELLQYYLSQGIDVVTANKAVIAEDGVELAALARDSGAEFLYSGAIGGSAPMLEQCRQHAGNIQSIAAVLNGTCNFVLDACARGATLTEAIAEAQRLGFAESDPTEDLSGRDAARKLQILTRVAFNVELPLVLHALDEAVAAAGRTAALTGERLRQVARAERRNERVIVSVNFERVDAGSAFFDLAGEWNALGLTLANGELITIRGRGAGRWPTSEAVIADAFDIGRGASVSPWVKEA
jgi:homoserine dehydrogenase